MKKKLNQLLLICLLFINFYELSAQRIIEAPELQDFAVCANPTDNSFIVTAVISSGNSLPADNEFILELSNISGDFSDPTQIQELARVGGFNNGSLIEQEIRFENISIPEGTSSETYRLRVRTSTASPEIISAISEEVAMYFFRDDLDIFLNNREDVIFCNVTSFTKTLTITLFDLDDNIVDPNDFQWEWFKDNALIVGESGSSIEVTTEGEYFARIPLGSCIPVFPFSRSNNVDVSLLGDVSAVTIETTAPDFSFCPNENKELMSSIIDFSYDYQWYKDDIALEEETAPTITLPDNDFGGNYILEVNFSDDCIFRTAPVMVVNEGSSITQPLPPQLILLPNQTLNLQITTDAPIGSPIRWIADTNIQNQATLTSPTTSFDAVFVANYRVEIDALDSCNSMLSSETDIFSPLSFEIVIGTSEGISCDQDPITIELIEMFGRISGGLLVPLTDDQLTFFDFEWFKDGVSTGDTSMSLDIAQSEEEGSFELRANLRTGEFTNIVSNNLPVTFLSNDIVLNATPPFLPIDGGTLILTAPLDSDFTYEWFRVVNGENELIENENENELLVVEAGSYFVRITSPLCSMDSLVIEIGSEAGSSGIIPNVVTPNSDGINDNWLLPPSLFNQQEVEVTIYNARGQVDFISSSYQNNWPRENSKSLGQDSFYYYIITKNNSVVRKGSITVMR